ncbi:MAG: DUF3108 domain-containing protein [Epsilonproteobacteria bacterium]|nr:DUF3108 domain-containing protein [Campylobacterota bacterium]
MRIILSIFIFSCILFAKDISALYKVSFGIFGQIGTTRTSLQINGKKYKILVHAKSTGFASFISGNRQEWYESDGEIVNGKLVPDMYKKIVQRVVNVGDAFNNENKTVVKKYILTYKFNHKIKTIIATKIKTQGKQRSEHSEKLKFYTDNDLLSLFFNFKKLFPQLDIKKQKVLYAVGANKDTGKINLYPLKKKEFSSLMSGNLNGLKFMKVILSDKIFASKKGELYLGLDNKGFCEKAVLKDVMLFGDIRGELIEKNY